MLKDHPAAATMRQRRPVAVAAPTPSTTSNTSLSKPLTTVTPSSASASSTSTYASTCTTSTSTSTSTTSGAALAPSRLPGAGEMVIVLCLAATAAFRLAADNAARRNGPAVGALLLTTLTAAVACLRPSLAGHSVRILLNQRHTAGLAVGSLCLPTLTGGLLAAGHEGARWPFWIVTPTSLAFLLAQLFGAAAADLHNVAAFRAVRVAQRVLAMSVGELCIVGQGLLLLLFAACSSSGWLAGALPGLRLPSRWTFPIPDDRPDDQVQVVVEVLLVGALAAVVLSLPLLRVGARLNFSPAPSSSAAARNTHDDDTLLSPAQVKAAYAVLLAVVVGIEIPWLHVALGQSPFLWLFRFLASRPAHMAAVVFWAGTLLAVGRLAPCTSSSTLPNIVIRKFFHFVAVGMFAPAVLLAPSMLRLAFAVALMFMVFLEVLRTMRVPPFGANLHTFCMRFLDSRDDGFVIVTHLYLIFGCAVTTWLPPVRGAGAALLPASGMLVLGVGDAAAATVGRLWGRCKWPGTHKTVEGTAAAAASIVVAAAALGLLDGDVYANGGLPRFLVATAVVALLETFTLQVDNLVLPLYFYSTLVLLAPP